MSSERSIIRDDVDPGYTWAIAQTQFPGTYMRHLDYEDEIAREGGKPISRSRTDVLSDFIGALDTEVSTEVVPMCAGTLERKFHEEIVMVVPTRWSDDLKRLALQVHFPPP
jgi:hypothetical protein